MVSDLRLKPGKVYRTKDLAQYNKNPTRLAGKLVKAGKLRRLRKGMFYVPRHSVFGEVPPSETEALKSYFHGRPYLHTGPSLWNALGLGSTAVEVLPLVYNTTRTGIVQVGGRRFELRRVKFPRKPSAEYFVVDLLANVDRAGVDMSIARQALKAALKAGRFNPDRLLAMAAKYGSHAIQKLIGEVLDNEDKSAT